MRIEAYRGREREGEGAGDVPREGDKLMASPAMRPPLWVEVLVGLTMADMAGTDSARAAVVGKEVRDIIAKEFVILQRLGKVRKGVLVEKKGGRGRRGAVGDS